MRSFLVLIFLCAALGSNSATYYFSTTGDDSRTPAQAQNQFSPWKTIDHFNSIFNNLLPGDTVLFERGKSFFGSMTINGSGTAAKPIVIGAYGNGFKPEITGLLDITSWTPIGGNIYENTCSTCQTGLNMVTLQDTLQPIGRWPKVTQPGAGYLALQSHVGTTSITSNAIAGAPDFVGGELVIRPYGWILDRARVNTQTATTVTYTSFSPTPYAPQNGFGFFFQNHINALSQFGDWMYASATKKFRMYFGAQNPANYKIKVSSIENLVNISYNSHIKFDSISFKGANSNCFNLISSTNISITNCDIQLSGKDGIYLSNNSSENLIVTNCNIFNSNNNAISANGSGNCLIQSNTIRNTGLNRGMGLSGDGAYNAVFEPGNKSLIEYNIVKNTGYNGIHFAGDSLIIKNNYFDSFCVIKSDGGAIYTALETVKLGRKIIGNIAVNGIGDRNGRSQGEMDNPFAGNVHGIYLDGGATNIEITGNTVANCSSSGLELSSPSNVLVTNNTLFNNTFSQVFFLKSSSEISNLTVKNNIFFAKRTDQLIYIVSSNTDNESTWGIIDSNYYCRPLSEPANVDTPGYSHEPTFFDYPDGGIIQAAHGRFLSLDRWQVLSQQDANTKKTPIPVTDENNIRFEYNPTNAVKTISLNTDYRDVKNQVYSNTLNLAPYSSIILIRSGPALLSQTINFPAIPNQPYGIDPFTISATASSGLPVSFSVVSGNATISANNRLSIFSGGIVVVQAMQAGNTTYNPAPPVLRVINVSQLNQGITFEPIPPKTFGAPPFFLRAFSTSYLPITYRIVSGPATLSGNPVTGVVLTITSLGTVVVEAMQGGNQNYNPAANVSQSFVVLAPTTSAPATYYFSPTGDDGRTSAQARNPATPWKTIDKFNSFFPFLLPGDAMLFERGKTFYGSLAVTASGTSSLPIAIGAYGSGANPVITGLEEITNWTPVGGNIYENTCSSCLPKLNLVIFQDTLQPIGRWPKTTAPNAGYLTIQSHSGTSSITSNGIGSAPSFVGGELVTRPYDWILDRARVISQTATTVNYAPQPINGFVYEPQNGYGFFFQNHINALGTIGDWMYDSLSKKVRVYFGGQNPANFSVKAATVEHLANVSKDDNINFSGITFHGANSNGVNIDRSTNISFNNCVVQFSGIDGIFVRIDLVSKKLTVKNCTVINSNNNGINANGADNSVFQFNIIKNTGLVRGMGLSGDNNYNALFDPGKNSLVEYNEIKNTGYIGIHLAYDSVTLKNNLVDSFCLTKSDGGGIYAAFEPLRRGRKVIGNVVLNGIGDRYGRLQALMDNPYAGNVHGIYMDRGTANVQITDNTIANCSGNGLELSSVNNIQVTNNTIYNNTLSQIYYLKSDGPFSNLILKNNIAFAKKSDQLIAAITTDVNDQSTWGIIDSNFYCRPISEPPNIDTGGYSHSPSFFDYPDGGIIHSSVNGRFYSLDRWQLLSGQDAHTKKTPVTINDENNIRFEYNPTNAVKTITLNSNYIDVKNQAYAGTISLAPYSSIILLALLNQTINFPEISNKTLGVAPFTISATASSGLPVSFRIISGPATISGNTITITGVGAVQVEASQAGNASYNPAPVVIKSFGVTNGTNCAGSTSTVWTGAVNTAWEVAGNWTCGVPNAATDVVIPGESVVVVSSNAHARSLASALTASITVKTGFNLTIHH